MLSKSQSISVRLSQEDYSYLMKIDRNGAMTQSEKVRELISLARDSVGTESFSRTYMSSVETLLPFKAKYKEAGTRSILIEAAFEFLEDSITAIQRTSQADQFEKSLESELIPGIELLVERLSLLVSEQGSSINSVETEKLKSKIIALTTEV